MSRRTLGLVLAMAVVLLVSSFYLRSLARRLFLGGSQTGEQEARTRLSEAALQGGGMKTPVTLYFPSDGGKLVPETRQIALASNDIDRARQILLALIEGSQQKHQPALPSTASIRAVFLDASGTAYIDFASEGLAGFQPGIETETLAVYAVVDSLAANLPAVKSVKFLIQGQEVDTLSGHVDLTDSFVPDTSRVAQ